MEYTAATKAEIKLAQAPHNLFISGLFIPLVCSAALIAWIYLRSRKTTTWFVDMHWKITFARSKLLMLGYAISATLIFLAWLISLSTKDHNMSHIIWTALTRVALMPTVILVLVTAVMEFSSYAQAAKREVPDKLAAKFPPPAA